MVVQNSVAFSVTQISSQVDRSKALNDIWSGQHLLVSSVKTARHMSSVYHNWSLLKSDRSSLQNTLPVSILRRCPKKSCGLLMSAKGKAKVVKLNR